MNLGIKSKMRGLKIIAVFMRYRLDKLLLQFNLPVYIRISLWLLWPLCLVIITRKSEAERLRLALEALGPIFIKFGQMLSTRTDMLYEDFAQELQKLQDQVPAFDSEQALVIIEQSLGPDLFDSFSQIDTQALASASVAQVHKAQLNTGESVVIKVVRPNIEKVIKQDVELLYSLAHFINKLSSDARRLRPVEVIAEYEKTIFAELDLRKEAANGQRLKENFDQSEILYIPEIYNKYSRKNVLVMEKIQGIPVTDVDSLEAQGIDMKLLAERGVEIFFTQVFRDSFFHADMHPGNIFIAPNKPDSPQYIAVDFGIVGALNQTDQSYLARNFLAFFQRDYRQVAQLHVDSGWVPFDTNVDEFEVAIRTVCDPIFNKPLKDISFAQLLLGLFQTARSFNMQVQPQLVLLQKTLLNIEGLGRQLYPELDLWKTAKPFLENWMKQRMGFKASLKSIQEQGPEWLAKLPEMPELLYKSLQKVQRLEEPALVQARIQKEVATQLQQRSSIKPILGLACIGFAGFYSYESSGAWLQTLPELSWAFLGLGLYWLLKR